MKIFSSNPFMPEQGLALVRMLVGLLLIYHGQEVFHQDIMAKYLSWDVFQWPFARIVVYAGKIAELFAGLFIFFGFLTRVGALLCIGVLGYVTFWVGHGKFWYEDQHPFLFVLFGLLFLFTGPGAWSLDRLVFRKSDH